MPRRTCDNCGNVMPLFVPRTRQADGSLWCEACCVGRPGRPRAQASIDVETAIGVLEESGFAVVAANDHTAEGWILLDTDNMPVADPERGSFVWTDPAQARAMIGKTPENGEFPVREMVPTSHWEVTYKQDYGWQARPKRQASASGIRHVAHDSGDGATIFHCPFCGSGQVIGGSDGTVECEFCHTRFTVQVQPNMPSMPQTVDGQPFPIPGMPGSEADPDAPPAQQPPLMEDGQPASAVGTPNAPAGANQPPSEADDDKDVPPFLRKKQSARDDWTRQVIGESTMCSKCGAQGEATGYLSELRCPNGHHFFPERIREDACGVTKGNTKITCELAKGHPGDHEGYVRARGLQSWSSLWYLTSEGAALDQDAYVRYLAIKHAIDRPGVLAQVRASRE